MNVTTYYLQIAGFTLAIDVKNVTEADLRRQLYQFISGYYSSQLIDTQSVGVSPRVDYTVYFVAEEQLKLIRSKETYRGIPEFFLRVFSIGKKHAYVDYHVGIAQFQFLIKTILQGLLARKRGFLLH